MFIKCNDKQWKSKKWKKMKLNSSDSNNKIGLISSQNNLNDDDVEYIYIYIYSFSSFLKYEIKNRKRLST
jgi:hypothetical protein